MLKIPILGCLFLIGGGYQLNDQYGPATGMARAFRNGITLDGRPKNEEVRAYFVKFRIFGKKCLKTKSPWKGPPPGGFKFLKKIGKNSPKSKLWPGTPNFWPSIKCHTISESSGHTRCRALFQSDLVAFTNEKWASQK